MNALVNRNAQYEALTQAGTPVRSAWSRKPVSCTQAPCCRFSTMVLPGARAASVATAPGSAWSMSCVLASVPGSTATTVAAATAQAALTATAARPGSAPTTASTSTRPAISGPDQ